MRRITGIILAGGKSSRMGTDKGVVELNNKKIIQYVVDVLNEVVSDLIIIANNRNYDYLGCRIYNDLIKEVGPLGGIYTGLYYSETEYNLIVSCDTPYLKKEILNTLIDAISQGDYDLIIAKENNSIHPLCAIYSKRMMKKLETYISKNELKLKEIVKDFKTKTIDFNSSTAFTNINTKEDLLKLASS
ncbi:MAG: molybdenum cofactor guanylyltransferase [Bacteroidetes bacterium]|nr:molybdenum cofactor guanylyltransferase [Bacteroidota bacterium]